MRSPLILLAFLVAPVLSCCSQELPEILNTQTYKRGVYKNLREFLQNSPSLSPEFQIVSKSKDSRIKKGKGLYTLVIQDTLKYATVWGVCDGMKIYINERSFGYQTGFRELLGVGRYTYFYGFYVVEDPMMVPTALTGVPPAAKSPNLLSHTTHMVTDLYVLNINNSKFFLLKKDVMRTILKNDKLLKDQYESDKNVGDDETLTRYIDLYNNKHKLEASTILNDSASLIIYRRDNGSYKNTISIALPDSTTIRLDPNSSYHFKSMERGVTLCVGGRCKEFFLSDKRITYLECGWDNRSKSAKLDLIENKFGEFHVKKINSSSKK